IAPGVSIVVENQETALRIAVDDRRIYWYSALPNGWSEAQPKVYARVRSCLKSDCTSTMTTYESITFDWNNAHTPRAYYALTVAGDNVYWVRDNGDSWLSILTCPSAG